MEVEERQHLLDDVACGFGVIEQIERVRRGRVVDDRYRQIHDQRRRDELADRVVEPGHLVATSSHHEHREIAREIVNRFASGGSHETKLFRRICDMRGPRDVERVRVSENRARQTVATVFHQN